jgi:predicted ATP-grasp superfamily ATP-dependent carboligase
VAAPHLPSLAGASRAARHVVVVPDALATPAEFASAVAHVVREQKIRVVLPMTDAAMLALLGTRGDLAPAVIPCPPLEAFRAISDKAALTDVAGRLGIAVPRQRVLASAADAAAVSREVRYPVVIKPARSVADAASGRAKFSVRHAATAEQCVDVARALPAEAFPALVQERIVGPGTGVFLLLWNGEVVASFAHERLREKPPAGGVSVYSRSVPLPADLLEQSVALLRSFGWCGVAMVEYKRDAATGTPYLMEVNGRFWGSLQLAIDAGVDFPTLLVECALGEPIAAPPAYRVGARSRWWWGDVDHLVARLRRSDAALNLPPGSPSRARAVWDFLTASLPGARDAVWRWTDPGPFGVETRNWAARR